MYYQYQAPAMSYCSVTGNSGLYYPGDGQIFVDTAAFGMKTCGASGVSAGHAPLQSVIGVAEESALPDETSSFRTANTLAQDLGTGGYSAFTGFTNTTDGSDHAYGVSFLLRDGTGLVAPPSGGGLSCSFTGAQSVAISGFMSSSRCFIATAAYGSGESAPVLLLREFRDQVLEAWSPGRAFVRVYYAHSPVAADWLLQHPEFKIPVLRALGWLEIAAWLTLHPWVLLLLTLSAVALILKSSRSREARP